MRPMNREGSGVAARMKGMAYGVGVGPGDPELLTLKACRLIRENEVVAVPGNSPENSVAYQIAAQAVPELEDKKIIFLNLPMVKDKGTLRKCHEEGARLIEAQLEDGRNVIILTLGDPTLYSTFSYIQDVLEQDGYETRIVNGVSSFCAAAASLNIAVARGNEPITILPSIQLGDIESEFSGTYVLMKCGKHMKEIKSILRKSGRNAEAVENCGMEEEKIYRSTDEMPDESGYLTVVISPKIH